MPVKDVKIRTGPPQHELKRLAAVHKKIVEMEISGMRPKDIAQELGLSPTAVTRIVKSPLFQDMVARRRVAQEAASDESGAIVLANARDALESASLGAVNKIVGLMEDSESESIQLRSASEILDRTVGRRDADAAQKIVLTQVNLTALTIALRESAGGRDDEGDDVEAEVVEAEVVPDTPDTPDTPETPDDEG